MFRIPPHVKLKEILREAYDRGQKFIVWKEQGVALPTPNYEHMHDIESIIGEIDQHEAYGVHLAAGLMKLWYSELREPLFPSSCYQELRKQFSNAEVPPSLHELTELFSTTSEWSILPMTSREICTRHLIPVLSAVSARSDSNKMTAENLAVCFAPTLVCGPDQLEDAKISSIVRRILTAAGELWSQGLRRACGVDEKNFALDLKAPTRTDDYEDPLLHEITFHEHTRHSSNESPISPAGFHEEQKMGFISMKDNESPIEKEEETPPPLPPRQPMTHQESGIIPVSEITTSAPPIPLRTGDSQESQNWLAQTEELSVRRKPAPPLTVPPRYSTIAGSPEDVTESPSTYMAPTNGFGPPRRGDWSFDTGNDSPVNGIAVQSRQNSVLRRKPVTPGGSGDEGRKV
jgi:Rho GTPase-activating protein 1